MRMVTNRLPHYGVAVLATAGASLLALFLSPLSLRVPFALFAAAVLVSSLEGGLKPGLLATALSTAALAVESWLLPLARFPENHAEVAPLLIVFVIVGLLSNYLGEQCWRAVQAVEGLPANRASRGDGFNCAGVERHVRFMNAVAHALARSPHQEAADRLLGPVRRGADPEPGQPAAHAIVRFLGWGSQAIVAEPRGNGALPSVHDEAGHCHDAQGTAVRTLPRLRDGRAPRLVDRELQQREEQFRSLAACAPAGILQMDPEGRCVYSNCSCQLVGGFSAEEGQGDGWAHFLHPQDQATVVPAWMAAMQAGKEFACEFRFQASQPGGRWVRLRSSPMVSDLGKLIGHIAVLQDIGDHKLAEEALRETQTLLSAVVEASADALFVDNLDGRNLLTNSAGARMLGKRIPEVVGQEEGGRAYRVRKLPLQDESGNLLGRIRICRAITQEEQLRAELAEAKAALESEARARQHAEEALRQCREQQLHAK